MICKEPPDDYVFDVLMPDLVGHDRAPSAFIVFLKLWHATGGPDRRSVAISLLTLAVETGLSKSSVQSALRRLQARGYIGISRASATSIPVYTVFAPWRH
ncbi:MAG: helix-turn-helix domain-containing protein [Alphaproteobacteria bacterium]|nr:helix-turn-helix domain-containing protein [Alphaproteobacteria bacterium]MDE2112484.1 helix-turn-helix domain-containing protein [Alphaproteobacteria bacterium]MDE2494005.1 helix-turn-helix domain-containing protein [Alphaproteobacteria bacterium]